MTKTELASYFDHIRNVKYYGTDVFLRLCEEAKQYGFCAVAGILPAVDACVENLKGSGVLYSAAIAFPTGNSTLEAKLTDIRYAVEHGADEIDYVLNLHRLADRDYDYIRKEMMEIADFCRTYGVADKAIMETCFLDDEQKRIVCEIARDAKPAFLKTSTGHGTAGASVEDVRLIKKIVGDEVKIKAAGGIRTREQAFALIEAGASRLGCSRAIEIMKEFDE